MAVITTSTFDPLKARVNVRLQQGVPIVDADWNELDDIRKFELRAYLKWYVGDGIPDGSDAFRIDAIPPADDDDFIIRAGIVAPPAGTTNYDQGLRFAGRAIVDGLDVIITADINYKAQPLFTAASFGVPQIAPVPNGTFAVYLDIWERLVTSQEDPSLVLTGIGTESCARMRREWCVRTSDAAVTGFVVPRPGDADFIVGHSYCLLAACSRAPGALIDPSVLSDRRHVGLSLASIESRLALIEQLLLTPRFAASPNQFNPKFGLPGANVTLFGNNFNVGTVAVRFGTTAATVVGTPGASQVIATVPSAASGAVKITVQTGGGSVTSDDDFTILAPSAPAFDASPNQFNPKFGPATTTNVTLFGSNFNVGTVAVRFGTTTATIVGTPTASQVIATVPSMASGPVKITVQTGGGSVTSNDDFTVT